MSDRTQWVHEVIEVLEELGGQATLDDIYTKVEDRSKIELSSYIDWKAQIRRHIYLNSSDTDIFKGSVGDNTDLFYSIESKGKGVWGLRKYQGKRDLRNETIKKQRNPVWNRDELILALDLYFKYNPNNINSKHKEVIRLSEILNSLPIHEDKPNLEKFRNPNGVYMKMCNFLRFDPNYKGVGLKGGGKLEEVVWNEFYNDKQRLNDIAQCIKTSIRNNKEVVTNPINNDEEEEFPEGKVLYRLHKQRERNNRVVKEKKQAALKKNELCCEICEFDFYKVYGELGKGFIECHHIIPVSEYKENTFTKLKDLVLVCSNCHRMLHRKRPWLSKEDLKCILESEKGK